MLYCFWKGITVTIILSLSHTVHLTQTEGKEEEEILGQKENKEEENDDDLVINTND